MDDHSASTACGGDNFNYGFETADYLGDKIDSWGWDHLVRSSNVNVWFEQMTDADYDSDGDTSLSSEIRCGP